MPTYVVLGKFTTEGIKNIKDSPERLEAAKKVLKSVGGEMKKFYYTLGQYDFVAIGEAPDAEAMMKAMMTIGSSGAVGTQTLTAIPAEKAAKFIKELP